MSPDQAMLNKALAWIRDRQLLDPQGDWRVYCPHLAPGGFSFEYANSVYPDVDDTAAIILAQVKHDPSSIDSDSVIAAVTWILGMQSSDGGWAAFDVDNNKLFLNRIPFSDMDSLCDTSSVDIIGRILEAFGLILKISSSHDYRMRCLFPQLRGACDRAIQYIEADGS
ncbi:Terpenoid cyclases/protein prenyltransferase alpha-alpha toroid [Penicillium capsulatum]|nr:Terpenoid cyclases/protein prenyltransferase alpha-alpha toroid [Penicillium capsulatum]